MIFPKQHVDPMNWIEPRPIVVVEDHFHHISKLAQSINQVAPEVFDSLTVVCLDQPGPDTTASIIELAERHRTLQFAASLTTDSIGEDVSSRVYQLEKSFFSSQSNYCKTVASFLRHEGLLIQDIELESLSFIPKDRWWESTFLATTIRGIFGQSNLSCSFFSNKRGYEATFGAELLAAGHDPRDVLNKNELDKLVVPTMDRYVKDHFFQTLTHVCTNETDPGSIRATNSLRELQWLQRELDLLIWPDTSQTYLVGGQLFKSSAGHSFSASSNEAVTWIELVQAALSGKGIPTYDLGVRISAVGASKAESTNSAARHIHSLRKRLTDSNSILTVDGEYRIADGLKVGIVEVN